MKPTRRHFIALTGAGLAATLLPDMSRAARQKLGCPPYNPPANSN